MTEQEQIEAIVHRATTDPAFRAALLDSPADAVRNAGFTVDPALLARLSALSREELAGALAGLGEGPRRAAS